MDDARITGFSRLECWKAASLFSKTLAFLGIQDAMQKCTDPSTTPGPWAGSVAHTDGRVSLLVSQQKWDKVKELVGELKGMIGTSSVQQKCLEPRTIRGFLVYVSRTYKWMVPYLKGIHLTIDGWRPDQDHDGYRMARDDEISASVLTEED